MMTKLVRYDEVSKAMYENFIEEWEVRGELIQPSIVERKEESYEQRLTRWQYEESDAVYDEGLVKATLFFLVAEDKIVGAIHLRHELNDFLTNYGGHIGYGVRPSERKKGYASRMLKELLEELRDRNYERVLLTCDDDNGASAGTIEKNGGVLENKITFDGKLVRRYWINLI